MPAAADIAQAAVPLGFFLTWCTNLRLLAHEFEQVHERIILRIRLQEVHGSELLIAAGGDLTSDMFSDQGNDFMRRYYEHYLEDYRAAFEVDDDDLCSVKESWDNYAKLAAVLTPRLLGRKQRQDGLWHRMRKLLWR